MQVAAARSTQHAASKSIILSHPIPSYLSYPRLTGDRGFPFILPFCLGSFIVRGCIRIPIFSLSFSFLLHLTKDRKEGKNPSQQTINRWSSHFPSPPLDLSHFIASHHHLRIHSYIRELSTQFSSAQLDSTQLNISPSALLSFLLNTHPFDITFPPHPLERRLSFLVITRRFRSENHESAADPAPVATWGILGRTIDLLELDLA